MKNKDKNEWLEQIDGEFVIIFFIKEKKKLKSFQVDLIFQQFGIIKIKIFF